MPQTQTPPHRSHRRHRRRSWSRTFLLALTVLLFLAVVLVGAYRLLVRRPTLDTPDLAGPSAPVQDQAAAASSETSVSSSVSGSVSGGCVVSGSADALSVFSGAAS